METIGKLTVPFGKMDRPAIVEFILQYVTRILAHTVQRHIALNTVKKRFHYMRVEYYAFVQFAHSPGVRYYCLTKQSENEPSLLGCNW